MSERSERVKSIFLSAARLDENERAELLGHECGDNTETSRHLLMEPCPTPGSFFMGALQGILNSGVTTARPFSLEY